MQLTPFVNLNSSMSSKMLHALNRQEILCNCKGIDTVTIESTILFLTEKYSANFASKFKPEYLIPKQF